MDYDIIVMSGFGMGHNSRCLSAEDVACLTMRAISSLVQSGLVMYSKLSGTQQTLVVDLLVVENSYLENRLQKIYQ